MVDEDETGEQQHHHGKEGEDHADAAGGERCTLAVLTALVGSRGAEAWAAARPGGGVLRGWWRRLRRRRGGGWRRGSGGRGAAGGQRREPVLG